MNPAVVIPAYKKAASLQRLLRSLSEADYMGMQVSLHISLDKGADADVIRVARECNWKQGEKSVREQVEHLGADRHVLYCSSLALQYGSVVVLEDDAFVSRDFYKYAVDAASFYENDPLVAQVSLYRYPFNELTFYPFTPLDSGCDVFLLRKPCSRGQLYTASQWARFMDFMETHKTAYHNDRSSLPHRIAAWAENNWERMFTYYLVHTGSYVVYPYHSYSTMFGEPGEHVKGGLNYYAYQSSMTGNAVNLRFLPAEKIEVRYDEYFEVSPACLSARCTELARYNFAVDLNGTKRTDNIKEEYLLTSAAGSGALLTFGKALRPVEMNVIGNLQGKEIGLFPTKSVKKSSGILEKWIKKSREHFYHYPDMKGWRLMLYRFFAKGGK